MLAGCSFAPRYAIPATEAAPAAYLESAAWKSAEPKDTSARGAWWSVFGDPELDALEIEATAANQDLKAAFARLQQARAELRVARADLFPTVVVGPSVSRTRSSRNAPGAAPSGTSAGNDFTLEADVSYELDVWGRVRNNVRAARAGAAASVADLATVTLGLQAQLASAYFQLRGTDAQQLLVDQAVADYERALTLTERRHSGGAAALSDVAQARALLETAKAQAADVRLLRAQLAHAIAVLLGRNASRFEIVARPLPAELAPPPIDFGLPSELLERRPDVAAAGRRVAAANARIGVARAGYFPVFKLAAGGSYESRDSSSWIDAPSLAWSLGAQALLTAFDAGRHRALSAQARAAYDEAVADYRGSVLNAYREVEDNIAALRELERASTSEFAAVTATQTALEQANYRYRAGIVTYLEVVATSNAALQAQLAARDIQIRRLTAAVLLVKALGGGWHGEPGHMANAEPESAKRISE